MSLFGTIQMSANALTVASLGMQVTGNNIANANTPGYIRERLLQSAIPGYKEGALVIGLGVRADGVEQVIDKFLEERLRNASSWRVIDVVIENVSLVSSFRTQFADVLAKSGPTGVLKKLEERNAARAAAKAKDA